MIVNLHIYSNMSGAVESGVLLFLSQEEPLRGRLIEKSSDSFLGLRNDSWSNNRRKTAGSTTQRRRRSVNPSVFNFIPFLIPLRINQECEARQNALEKAKKDEKENKDEDRATKATKSENSTPSVLFLAYVTMVYNDQFVLFD